MVQLRLRFIYHNKGLFTWCDCECDLFLTAKGLFAQCDCDCDLCISELMGCSHGTIAIYLLQQMGCVGFKNCSRNHILYSP